MIRVVIADDIQILRKGLWAILSGDPELLVAGLAANGREDFPEIKILVLTTFDDRKTVEAALRSGADGYILKEMEDSRVIQSVKAVCAGVRVFGDSVFEEMRRQIVPVRDNTVMVQGITPREREIMRCVARGMDNKEIAAELFLAEGTVRNHISRLLEKLKLKDRTQLAVFTVKNGLD